MNALILAIGLIKEGDKMKILNGGNYPDGVQWEILRYDGGKFRKLNLYELRHFSNEFGIWFVVTSSNKLSDVLAVRNEYIRKVVE